MVGVQVGEQHDRHPADPQPAQAPVDRRRVRPGVDHHRGTGRDREHQAVALADVADRQHPAVRRPARCGRRDDQGHAQRDRRAGRRQRTPAQHPSGDDRERRAPRPAAPRRATDPGQSTAAPGTAADRVATSTSQPTGTPAAAASSGSRPGAQRRDTGREHAEHRRGRDRRGREEVRDDGHQADLAAEQDHDRRARPAARRAGPRVPPPAGAAARGPSRPAPSPAPAAPGRRSPGPRARSRTSAPATGRPAAGTSTAAASAARLRRRRPVPSASSATAPITAARSTDGCGRASTTNARHRQGSRGRQPAPAQPGPAPDDEHEGDDDREVGAADRGEVRQPRGAEVVDQPGRHPRGVADDQSGQQPALGRREHPRGPPQPGPQVAGRPLHRRRTADERRRAADRDDRGHRLAGAGRTEPAGQCHPLPGKQARASAGRGPGPASAPGCARPGRGPRPGPAGPAPPPGRRRAPPRGRCRDCGPGPRAPPRSRGPSRGRAATSASPLPRTAARRSAPTVHPATRQSSTSSAAAADGPSAQPAPAGDDRREQRRPTPSTASPPTGPAVTRSPRRRRPRRPPPGADQPGVQRRRSHRHRRPQVGQRRLTDAGDLAQLVDRAEPAVRGPPVEDPLRQHRPDAGQPVQRLERRAC